MMKNFLNFLIAFSLLTVLNGCGSETVNFDELQDRAGVLYQVNQTAPFSGQVESVHENGQVKIKGAIMKGLKEGLWVEYYDNGQKKLEGKYEGSLKEGNWKYWNKNGTVEKEENYQTGVRLGEVDNRTTTKKEKERKKGSSTTGSSDKPQDDETKEQKSLISLDRLSAGFVDGRIRKTYNGAPYSGPIIDYHRTGEVALRGQYKEGIRHGKWTWYHPNGSEKNVKNYD